MKYPSKTQIIACVGCSQLIKDAVLKGGVVATKANGSILSWSGGFSMVFRVKKGLELWAFKVWDTPLDDMQDRYEKIQRYLNRINLPYFTEFAYEEKGLFVDEAFIPTHRMRWVNGITLDEYIEKYIDQPKKILAIAAKFKDMVETFHKFAIAHGDLQHGNIMISDEQQIVVIDYDSMNVPDTLGLPDLIKGLGGYQHPKRLDNEFIHAKLDYFSELVIYLSLIVYSERPDLWDKTTDWLLFSKEDLEAPKSCNLIAKLKNSDNILIAYLTSKLEEMLSCTDIDQLQPLEEILSSPIKAPIPSLTSITNKF